MSIINASDLRPGMILAADAKGSKGQLLLPKGTVLEEQHIRVLNIWGAVEAEIENLSRDEAQAASLRELNEEHVAAAERYVAELFSKADLESAPMGELRTLFLKHYAERFASGEQLSIEAFQWEPISQHPSAQHRELDDFIASDKGLASFPDIYFKINEALDDPKSTANRLADVISKDPSISAKLLSLVNSPFYGFGQHIDSLSRSVALVGARELSQLALGVAVMDLFIGMPDGIITVRGFWQHSIACGVLCRTLASHIPGMSQERCFVVGLLHDIGRLVMLKLAPQEVAWAMNTARINDIPLYKAEAIVFGFDHAQVSEALFTRWNLPQELLGGVAGHHSPAPSNNSEAAICTVADAMAIAMRHSTDGTSHVHTIPQAMWQSLHLPESVLEATLMTATRQIDDILTVFLN